MILLGTVALSVALAAAPALEAGPAPARWGELGHRTIARTAELQLSGHARRAARSLLSGQSLAEASTWADQVRKERPATSPWHYVNIPIWESGYRPEFCPRAACVIGTLESQQKILADRSASRADRAEALRWVIHLVGDLHAPLHAGDRGDRGGNDLRVELEGRQTNLHAAWDSGLLAVMQRREEELVKMLVRRIPLRGDLAQIRAGTIADWAMESHDRARDVVYGLLAPTLVLDGAYRIAAAPVIEDQMFRASVRLAWLIEQALGED
ncbi:MAG: S1/P1 nuclease [Gemmatimonadales bacterium]|nr:S1/P1 nuclease [Gemmatimonadales bacterium]